jgi:hypothetical protein
MRSHPAPTRLPLSAWLPPAESRTGPAPPTIVKAEISIWLPGKNMLLLSIALKLSV